VQTDFAPEARGCHVWLLSKALLSAAVFGFATPLAAEEPGLQPWSEGPLPSFELPILSDEKSSLPLKASLAEARGHGALVHFFATWCEPCRKELPALERLSARANGAIKVYVISVDEPELRLHRFVTAQALSLPILLDQNGSLAKSWNIVSLPTTVLFDAELHPRFIARADQDWDQIEPAALLSNPAASETSAISNTTSVTQAHDRSDRHDH